MKCPCCREKLRIRTTTEEAPCFKNLWYECSNFSCGATFKGHQTIVHQIRASGLEKPFMVVPMASSAGALKPRLVQATNPSMPHELPVTRPQS
ncbi:ogr/Delta-like zinc finger family protein [Pseudomonas sp. WAC2]|uniref:ogr/Delta-like zinc finger family protein n=1 Tax=Pseudomonas sp. WAC2 TaxID=3055057 RepID=UPI00339D4458